MLVIELFGWLAVEEEGGEEIKIRSIQTPKFIRTQIILDFIIIDINMTIFPFAYKKVTKELHRSLLLVRHMHEDNSNIDDITITNCESATLKI